MKKKGKLRSDTLPALTCTLALCSKIKILSNGHLTNMIVCLANISTSPLHIELIKTTSIVTYFSRFLRKINMKLTQIMYRKKETEDEKFTFLYEKPYNIHIPIIYWYGINPN